MTQENLVQLALKTKFRMRSPIMGRYRDSNDKTVYTQLYGENKNKLFYGPMGHEGVDLRTQGFWEYRTSKQVKAYKRNEDEFQGRIPIQAAHDGEIVSVYSDDLAKGIGVKIVSKVYKSQGIKFKFETLYYHLDSVRIWKDDPKKTKWEEVRGENFVKEGTVIGTAGNSGPYTTGAHLHFSFTIWYDEGNGFKRLNNEIWGMVDPMPFFRPNYLFRRANSTLKIGSMKNLSMTMGGWLAMLLSQALVWADMPMAPEKVEAGVQVVLGVAGLLAVYWGRYRQGNITWYGKKK